MYAHFFFLMKQIHSLGWHWSVLLYTCTDKVKRPTRSAVQWYKDVYGMRACVPNTKYNRCMKKNKCICCLYEPTNKSTAHSFCWFILFYVARKPTIRSIYVLLPYSQTKHTVFIFFIRLILWCFLFVDVVEMVDSLRIRSHANERCKTKHGEKEDKKNHPQRHVCFSIKCIWYKFRRCIAKYRIIMIVIFIYVCEY